jgi:hypothetical protein
VIRYQGSASIRQGKTVIEGECVVESEGDQLADADLPWSGRFHDPAPGASLEEERAWLRLDEEPVREGAIKITRAGSGSSAGLIDFDGIGSMRDLR